MSRMVRSNRVTPERGVLNANGELNAFDKRFLERTARFWLATDACVRMRRHCCNPSVNRTHTHTHTYRDLFTHLLICPHPPTPSRSTSTTFANRLLRFRVQFHIYFEPNWYKFRPPILPVFVYFLSLKRRRKKVDCMNRAAGSCWFALRLSSGRYKNESSANHSFTFIWEWTHKTISVSFDAIRNRWRR